MADGWITIGTKLSTDKFDRQIGDLERKMQKEEEKKVVIEANLDKQKQELEDTKAKVDELANAYQKVKSAKDAVASGKATPEQFMMASELQATYGTLEQIDNSLNKALNKQDSIEQKVSQTELKYKGIVDNVNEYQRKINQVKLNKQTAEAEKLKRSFKDTENTIQRTVGKLGKMALGLFGIRSALSGIRSMSSELASYDEQYATDLEYIRFVLAQALAPLLKGIVQLAFQLLKVINMVANALFGVNLFANGSAENFQKMKNSASGASKAVKEIKKQLMGFDEVNVLTSQSDTGTSAGAGGVGIPTEDLSELNDIEVPDWITWIKEHWKDVAFGILKIVGAILLLKLVKSVIGSLLNPVTSLTGVFGTFFTELGKAIKTIAILGGIALVINSITGLIDTFSQSGLSLGEVAGLLGIVLGELVGAFILLLGAMTLLTPSWQSVAAATVILAGFALVINQVTSLLEAFSKTGMTVGEVAGLMAAIFVPLIALMGAIVLLGPNMTAGLIPFSVVVAEICVLLLVMKETLPTILEACGKFITDVAPSIKMILETIGNLIEKIIYALGTALPPIIESVGNLFDRIFNGISRIIRTVGDVIIDIMNTAKSLVIDVLHAILDFINELGPAINNFVDNAIVAVTKLINFLISGIEYLINTLIVGAINSLINSVSSAIPFFELPKLPKVHIDRFVPQLKVGGIVNMPNKGTLVGGAIAGEAGREGVIPLTDTQAMETLGEAIGRYITINANITNTMNGRVISRELKQIQNQQDFAYNV